MRLMDGLLVSPNEMESKELTPFQEWHDTYANQLVLFIKPEVTGLHMRAEPVLEMIEDQLVQWQCNIRSLRLIGSSYLRKHNLIDDHYGAINLYSRQASHLALQPPPELAETPVLGAHEFLSTHPSFEPRALLRLHGESTTMRLGPGAYAFHYQQGGESLIVVNGFHPAQLEHFYAANSPILVIHLSSPTPWRLLRNEMVGATDPRAAHPGSIRHVLLRQSHSWGIEVIDSMRNGVHLSAGPLEGGQELRRFFSSPGANRLSVKATNVGPILSSFLGEQAAQRALENSDAPFWDTYTETELMDTWELDQWLRRKIHQEIDHE